jgi:hypothetical protein
MTAPQTIRLDLSTIFKSSPLGLSSHQASAGNSSFLLPPRLPSSQSVTLTTRVILSQCPPSSVCSITCFAMRPSSSNSKMKMPQNSSSSALASKPEVVPEMNFLILSTGSRVASPTPRYMPPVPSRCFVFPQVFHFTMSFSSRFRLEADDPPFLTMRSLSIVSLTFPTSGSRPQATGAVQRAAT